MNEQIKIEDSPWDQKFYITLLEEVDPFNELHRFRPLSRAYTGNNTFWETPSPEPDLDEVFWKRIADYVDVFPIQEAAQNLAASICRYQPDNSKLLFVSVLRAGVPVADWLTRMLPGSRAASLSLFVGLGIDRAALAQIKTDNPDRDIVFVDGWTGRGGVAREIARLNSGPFAVLIDPWGWADFSGAQEDIFCYSACFTGLATLGFSRTFFIDEQSCFSAYRFPRMHFQRDVVEVWQNSCPKQHSTYFQPEKVEFFKETILRIHSNEVCRALINAAPDYLLFRDSRGYVRERFELLLALAERRKVSVKYDQLFLREYQTRVACTLKTA